MKVFLDNFTYGIIVNGIIVGLKLGFTAIPKKQSN